MHKLKLENSYFLTFTYVFSISNYLCIYITNILKHGNFKYIHIFQHDVSHFIHKYMGNYIRVCKIVLTDKETGISSIKVIEIVEHICLKFPMNLHLSVTHVVCVIIKQSYMSRRHVFIIKLINVSQTISIAILIGMAKVQISMSHEFL